MKKSTILIKKHRHVRLLGQIRDCHLNAIPRDFREDKKEFFSEMMLEAARKALAGNPAELESMCNSKQTVVLKKLLG